jgi:hypothetical protein
LFSFYKSANAVLVLPKWLIIQDNQRAARVIVYNKSNVPKVVTFEWERRAINEEGKFVKLKPGETVNGYSPADPYIKFSPRKVVLQPKQNQKIRLMVQRPADMKQGEYRSHFAVHEEKLETAKNKSEGLKKQGMKGTIELSISTSIPVLLRHGETTIDYKITRAEIVKDEDLSHIDFTIENNSTRSIYGRVELECTYASGEVITETIRGIRLYVESKTIQKRFPIKVINTKNCQALKMKIFGKADREYLNKLVSEYDVYLM